jgi:hypothetical protein
VVANLNGEAVGDLGFDLDSEGRLVVYHTSDYALSRTAWQDLFALFFLSSSPTK